MIRAFFVVAVPPYAEPDRVIYIVYIAACRYGAHQDDIAL